MKSSSHHYHNGVPVANRKEPWIPHRILPPKPKSINADDEDNGIEPTDYDEEENFYNDESPPGHFAFDNRSHIFHLDLSRKILVFFSDLSKVLIFLDLKPNFLVSKRFLTLLELDLYWRELIPWLFNFSTIMGIMNFTNFQGLIPEIFKRI